MKLKELIQRLEKLNPEAEAHFQWLEPNGHGNTSSKANFVDVVDIHGQVTIRIADPTEIQAVRLAPVD